MKLGKLFLSSSIGSIASAALNLLATIAIVRWYGDGAFTDYSIDLAYLALIGILIELIPSNFSVFKLQDNPEFIKVISLFTILMTLISFAITVITLQLAPLFKSDTYWIAAYSSVLAFKKYLDIRLQSLGRIKEFFIIEATIAGLRLLLLWIFFCLNIPSTMSIWGSIVIATTIIYCIWILANKEELRNFTQCLSNQSWSKLLQHRNIYPSYYFGIILKRVRDNIIIIVAPHILLNKQDLASFFLAYRGLSFALGQIKIIEAILNFRKALETAKSISIMQMFLIAIGAQLLSVLAIALIIFSSGLSFSDWSAVIILSLICWVYVFYSRIRANALSNYQQRSINISSLVYIALISLMFFILIYSKNANIILFSIVLLISEIFSVFTLKLLHKGR